VWQAVYAVVEVTGDPEHDPARERWAWRFPIRPLEVVDDLRAAPAVEEIGVFPQSVWRHSHIRLTDEQFGRAERAIAARARHNRHVEERRGAPAVASIARRGA